MTHCTLHKYISFYRDAGNDVIFETKNCTHRGSVVADDYVRLDRFMDGKPMTPVQTLKVSARRRLQTGTPCERVVTPPAGPRP